ncbi:lipopolysaccharide biosynthesis protein [Parafrigoribacterium soli]|uniref:lipopolysaccharide biosynthesis protein n=1 Tax=Parafrigoribacterium soli TaxID=3144663 RepID=UPI0032EAFEC8
MSRARRWSSNGALLILAATVVAGIAGYLVTLVVYRFIGPAAYAVFAIFWATLYLVIGASSGVQQEITRATSPIGSLRTTHSASARNFALVAAAVIVAAIVCSAPLWVDSVFPAEGWALVWPLAVGAGGYVLVAVLAGSLYGVRRWSSLFLMIVVDGLMRFGFVMIVLIFTQNVVALAWVVAVPFPLTLVVLWPFIRAGIVGRSELDTSYRTLSWNSARTVLASMATAVLVSGFPMLLGVTSRGESAVLMGQLIFTITLTRAPLIVTAMSLQSYFVVHFRHHRSGWWRFFLGILGLIVAGGAVLGALGWWLGPAVFEWVSGKPFALGGGLIAVLVASSALVGALFVTGPAVLARGQHRVYSLGWVAAALLTIGLMITPIDFLPRVTLALLIGPVAGLLVHLSWLVASRAEPVDETQDSSIEL